MVGQPTLLPGGGGGGGVSDEMSYFQVLVTIRVDHRFLIHPIMIHMSAIWLNLLNIQNKMKQIILSGCTDILKMNKFTY